jgi:hypothetical protein
MRTIRTDPCDHVLSGRTEIPKRCIWNHECFHCAFDQLLDTLDRAHEDEAICGEAVAA